MNITIQVGNLEMHTSCTKWYLILYLLNNIKKREKNKYIEYKNDIFANVLEKWNYVYRITLWKSLVDCWCLETKPSSDQNGSWVFPGWRYSLHSVDSTES